MQPNRGLLIIEEESVLCLNLSLNVFTLLILLFARNLTLPIMIEGEKCWCPLLFISIFALSPPSLKFKLKYVVFQPRPWQRENHSALHHGILHLLLVHHFHISVQLLCYYYPCGTVKKCIK